MWLDSQAKTALVSELRMSTGDTTRSAEIAPYVLPKWLKIFTFLAWGCIAWLDIPGDSHIFR